MVGCILYALSADVSAWIACLLLVIAMGVHVAGELFGSVGSWSIGFELADPKYQGQYQGAYSLGWGLGGTFGPTIVTALAITLGQVGWMILALIFVVTGILMRRLVCGTWFGVAKN